jgi:hypothetical protein
MMKIGSSQNFFRTRRNIQNSARNESMSSPRIDDPPGYGPAAFHLPTAYAARLIFAAFEVHKRASALRDFCHDPKNEIPLS